MVQSWGVSCQTPIPAGTQATKGNAPSLIYTKLDAMLLIMVFTRDEYLNVTFYYKLL